MHIDHVNIKATAGLLEELRNFYASALGLETGPRPAFGEHGYWLYSGDHAVIHLSECSQERGSGTNAAFDHFALRVPDLTVIIERLQHQAIEYQQSIVPGTGLQQVFFRDPSGTRVEVQGPTGK